MASVYRYRQQQSVNLLGAYRFLNERWMTPSLFLCASGSQKSELDIASGWNSTKRARAVLERHWDTFISSSDFSYLSSIGINTVRLPIGYFSLGPKFCADTPFADVADVYERSWNFIVRAINWAGEAGIGVLVDLHGAVNSQNGQPHSGISDGVTGLFDSTINMDKTVAVLKFLMQELCNVTNVVGIQILNEPQNVPGLPDFYTRAISELRSVSASAATFPLYIHDGFDLKRFSNFVASRDDFVVQDHHSYFVFTPSDGSKPASQLTKDVNTTTSDSLAAACAHQRCNLVVDEWSAALTPESISKEADQVKARQDFGTAQVEVYSTTTSGWSFWSYKKEDCDSDPGWCFIAAVGTSIPATFFSYGKNGNPAQMQSIRSFVDLPPISDVLSRAEETPPRSGKVKKSTAGFSPSRELNLRRSISPFKNRLSAIHLRRSKSQSGINMTAEQQSTTKGYSDGFLTALLFADCNMSKLGFVAQYTTDNIKALGPAVIKPGTEKLYHYWFKKGLADSEAGIRASLAAHPET
ncbi:glycoside hydrolase superfamily [Mycena rebaudengoi]|nr:glycoside hydrolase superfamily [Mycena rebaudengoi]